MRARTKPGLTTVEKYGNTWTEVVPSTADDLAPICDALGRELPAELADLFLTCGGGRPERDFFLSARGEEHGLGYIIPPVDYGKMTGFVDDYQTWRATHGEDASPKLIPFALDSGHANFFCIREPSNDVVYWLHDEPDNRIRLVATSLRAFLTGLTASPF